MKVNGLEFLERLISQREDVEIINDESIVEHSPENAWFVAYLDNRVVVGRLIDKGWSYFSQDDQDVTLFPDANIQKLRIFNKDAELFVWRTALGRYKARLRNDTKGTAQKAISARQILFGTKATMLDERFATLVEERGTQIILPLTDLGIGASEINDLKGRLCIHTRTYITTIEETGQATYDDVRFVEFVKYSEEL